jgi:thioredoxin reductase (NADPH)
VDNLATGRAFSTDRPGSHPLLTPPQLSALRRYGSEHDVVAGDLLFSDGDPTYDLIVVIEGEVQVIERHGKSDSAVISTYGPREFPGEIGMLTGQRAYLTALVTTPGRVLRVSPERLRVVMAEEPDLSELILRAFLLRHGRLARRGSGLTLVGSRFDSKTRVLLELLARNRLSSRWMELEGSTDAEAILQELEIPVSDLPIVIVPGAPLLRNPSARSLLDALGLTSPSAEDHSEICDLLVVGGGPGGLAAAVYGASEGLATTLTESTALGGQAGTSSRIENYLGFPAGLSGEELAARAALQARKFGVRIKLAARATSLRSDADRHHVHFDNGEVVTAKSVIIATGARYKRLALDRLTDFEGVGVYYAATQAEAQACADQPVLIIGGGNSAGQAALFLAQHCADVHIAVRGPSLSSSMSRYLIDQIERQSRIHVSPATTVTALVGTDRLEAVKIEVAGHGSDSLLPVCGLFVFIGAVPSTDWLQGQLAQDDDGFLLSGTDLASALLEDPDHQPLPLETSRAGIFVVGDVRSRSVKRAATAIGEGSMAVRLVFDRLDTTGLATADPPRPDSDPADFRVSPSNSEPTRSATNRS